jgi:dTDP-D-glucose 4,6-dehydratase
MEICKLLLAEFKTPAENDSALRERITFVKDRPFNDHRYAVDGNKLKALGWSQNTSFAKGLTTTVAWWVLLFFILHTSPSTRWAPNAENSFHHDILQ